MTKKKAEKKTEKSPVVETIDAERPPVRRSEVFIAGKKVYVEAQAVLQFMILEMATKDLDKQGLADFSKRFNLKIEAFSGPTGDATIVLCENGVVNWVDGEVAVGKAATKSTKTK